MSFEARNYNTSSVILYSSILILVSELLLAKVSIQLYSIFSPLPLILIALIINYRDFLISVVFSLLQILLIKVFMPSFLPSNQVIFFHTIISFLVLFFFGTCNLASKLKLESSNLISLLIMLFITSFSIFYLVFLNTVDHAEIRIFFKNIIVEILDAYKVQNKNNINELVDLIIAILPSINSLMFLITFCLNFIFGKYVLKKLGINQNDHLNFKNLITPNWFSFLYCLILIILVIIDSNSDFWIFSLNAIICMSFSFLLEGYKTFNNFFTNINLDKNIKFLIIFLLFLFLGYLLLLILLILGFLENLKRIKKIK